MFRNIFLNWNFPNKSMLESIISFSSLCSISFSLWVCSQISLNSSNVVFSIKIAGNLQKMLVKIRLLIIDVNSQVLFSQTVPKCRMFTTFQYFSYFKTDSLNHPFKMNNLRGFQKMNLLSCWTNMHHKNVSWVSDKFLKFPHNIRSQFNYHTLPVTPFKSDFENLQILQ